MSEREVPSYEEVREVLYDAALAWEDATRANSKNTNGVLGASYVNWKWYVDRLRRLFRSDPPRAFWQSCVFCGLNDFTLLGSTTCPDRPGGGNHAVLLDSEQRALEDARRDDG